MFERASSVGLQSLDFLFPGSDLASARTSREARDEFVQLRNLLFPLRILRLDPGANLRLLQNHVVVSARIGNDGLIIDVRGVSRHAIQEMAVV